MNETPRLWRNLKRHRKKFFINNKDEVGVYSFIPPISIVAMPNFKNLSTRGGQLHFILLFILIRCYTKESNGHSISLQSAVLNRKNMVCDRKIVESGIRKQPIHKFTVHCNSVYRNNEYTLFQLNFVFLFPAQTVFQAHTQIQPYSQKFFLFYLLYAYISKWEFTNCALNILELINQLRSKNVRVDRPIALYTFYIT